MKKKFTFQNLLLFVLILAGIYRFSYLSAEKSKKSITITGDTLGFINYVTAPGWVDTAPENYWDITNQFDSYKELNYNTSHMFVTDAPSMGNFNQDVLTPIQIDSLNRIISMSGQAGLNCYLERVRISALCYSQRLIYEAEGGNYGFSYQRRTANIETDGDRTVIHACRNTAECPQADATPRMLCDSIYENLQHTDLYYFWPGSTDNFQWKIKPVMKIDSNDFSPGDETPVVAIFTKNYYGNDIDTTIIRVKHFGLNSYSGDYIQSYIDLPLQVNGHIDSANSLSYGRPAPGDPIKDCKVDFQVYWYGLVDVWFDKMIVDDERADKLFNLDTNQNFDKRIRDEVNTLGDNIIYYVDELTSSQTSTTKYVRDKMRDYSNGKAKMQFALSNNLNLYSHRDSTTRNKMLFDSIQPDIVCLDDHVFQLWGNDAIYLPNNIQNFDPRVPPSWKISPESYNQSIQIKAFGNKTDRVIDQQGTFVYQLTNIRNDLKDLSPLTKFVVQPHLHSWTLTIDNEFKTDGFREPTNEEIQATGMLAIAHGAQGLSWVNYQSNESSNINSIGDTIYSPDTSFVIVGLRNEDHTKRTQNIIYQNKWEYVKAMNLKILHWKPTLDKIKWDSGYSVHHETADHKFIKDIKSLIVRPGPQTACYEDNINYDCAEERYWEMGFFDPDFNNPEVSSVDKSKYFIMVNRRCVPDVNNDGDLRQLKIKFDSTQLSGFVNWKITELDSNNVVAVFNKNTTSYIDMRIFNPGEGKLYRLAPVIQEGGTLVADETINNINFNCNGDVNNNGKNITIYVGTTVSFANEVNWNITGGDFQCGLYPDTPNELKVNLTSQSGSYWNGINFTGCGFVSIGNTVIENIKHSGSENEDPSVLQFVDCYNLNISDNTFNFSNSDSISCINLSYLKNEEEVEITPNILNNRFYTGSNSYPSLICTGFAESVIPLMINGNEFNSSQGNTAIFLSNVSAGVIKNNSISNFNTGIDIISSTSYADLYNNDINGDSCITGIKICDGTINLGLQGSYQTGGFNELYSGNINATNLYSGDGYFTIDQGLNTFNINNNTSAYHLSGLFNSTYSMEEAATENCFKLNNSISSPRENVGCQGLNCDVIFEFEPTVCAIEQNEEYLIVDLGNQIYDTIYITGGGSGAGVSVMKSLSHPVNLKKEITPLKELYASVCIEMRKHNYESVHLKCMDLLINYTDSSESIDALSKLYLSDLMLDRSGDKMTPLKTFFESIILNNGNNEELIKKSNYLIQKTKVSLGQYQSAMTGFQQIMEQNPYSYEALVASWDYAATNLLLIGFGGSGGGISDYKLQITNEDFNEDDTKSKIKDQQSDFLRDDPNEKYDKKAFTKEDRKVIKSNVFNSFETNRDKKIEFVKNLQKKVADGNANQREKKELETKKVLKELARPKKPVSVSEHINNISSDINKITASGKGSIENKNANVIPEEYYLSQNYPNPFNPTTKITFDLPVDAKVKLIVYDILGKEIIRLVNNEYKTAGSYTLDFNGGSLSSGVYFYRMETEGAKNFSMTKRMVLIK